MFISFCKRAAFTKPQKILQAKKDRGVLQDGAQFAEQTDGNRMWKLLWSTQVRKRVPSASECVVVGDEIQKCAVSGEAAVC